MPAPVSPNETTQPVLILGAGIHGCALARELVLNGVPVVLVDEHDVCTGATAKSSRLIHGGLRYLEYGDFGLVRESLAERDRGLKLMPHFVRPLQIHIPIRRRFGGLMQAGIRFLKLSRFRWGRTLSQRIISRTGRGLWVSRLGLLLYDVLTRRSPVPSHRVHRVTSEEVPDVDPEKYRWTLGYYDGQMAATERFVVALLEDTRRAAVQRGTPFELHTYSRVQLDGTVATLTNLPTTDHSTSETEQQSDPSPITFRPSVIVNATGAWGDWTLRQLGVESPRLMGGTKGSHFITVHPGLKAALRGEGVYAEAPDGRMIFVLPLQSAVLAGTTDIRFEGRPDEASASADEIQYLLEMTNALFPQVQLTAGDVIAHYSGVRPLPYVPSGRTGSIPRGHWIVTQENGPVPVETLVGGKLTTWRPFAQEAADCVLSRLKIERTVSTDERGVPGGEIGPADPAREQVIDELCNRYGWAPETGREIWNLFGSRCADLPDVASETTLPGTRLPIGVVDWVIEHEWVQHLEDLVERRLLLAWNPDLSAATLETLADRLIAADRLDSGDREHEIATARQRLQTFYGVSL